MVIFIGCSSSIDVKKSTMEFPHDGLFVGTKVFFVNTEATFVAIVCLRIFWDKFCVAQKN